MDTTVTVKQHSPLLSMPASAFSAVLGVLPLADRRRLARTCSAAAAAVRGAAMRCSVSAELLEAVGADALSGLASMRCLDLRGLELSTEDVQWLCAVEGGAMMSRLSSACAAAPPGGVVLSDDNALGALVDAAPGLRALRLVGSWLPPGEGSTAAAGEAAVHQPCSPPPPPSALQSLALVRNAALSGAALACLLGHSGWGARLRELDVTGSATAGPVGGWAVVCPSLTRLCVRGCAGISSASLAPGSLPSQLCALDVSYTRVGDAGVAQLAAATPCLHSLAVKGCNVGDDGIASLLQLTQLSLLHCKHCHRITEEGMGLLHRLPQLADISYGYTSMPDADEVAAALARCTKLTALDFLSSELTDVGLESLSGLRLLARMALYQAAVTGTGLAALGAAACGAQLSSLLLYGLGGVHDFGFLESLPALRELSLGGLADLRGGACAALTALRASLPRLAVLRLERLDGLGGREGSSALRRLLSPDFVPALRALVITGCDGVSGAAAEALAAAAATAHSSASIYWQNEAPIDTEDEDDDVSLPLPA